MVPREIRGEVNCAPFARNGGHSIYYQLILREKNGALGGVIIANRINVLDLMCLNPRHDDCSFWISVFNFKIFSVS